MRTNLTKDKFNSSFIYASLLVQRILFKLIRLRILIGWIGIKPMNQFLAPWSSTFPNNMISTLWCWSEARGFNHRLCSHLVLFKTVNESICFIYPHDMLWYTLLRYHIDTMYDMIWYNIWYHISWYEIYHMINLWYILYDVMWCDLMWYDMIWYVDIVWYHQIMKWAHVLVVAFRAFVLLY